MRRLALAAVLAASVACPALAAPHNVVIFVADGLRYGSVTPDVAPDVELKPEPKPETDPGDAQLGLF